MGKQSLNEMLNNFIERDILCELDGCPKRIDVAPPTADTWCRPPIVLGPKADDLVERLKFYAQGIRAGDITSPQFDADIMSEAADTIVAQQHDIDRLVGASSELATENEALRRKVAELKESARKLATLSDACSDQVYGGECGWERVDFKEFVKRVRTRLHSAEAAEARISELTMHQSLQDSTTAAVMERAEKAEREQDALARAVMLDEVSNDHANVIRVFKVTFSSGETCHFGEHSTAVAAARGTGRVESIDIPRRDFKMHVAGPIDAAMTGSTK